MHPFPFLPAKLAPWISCLLPLAGILWCFGLFFFFVRALCCASNRSLSSDLGSPPVSVCGFAENGAGSDSTPVGESISWQLQSSDGWISPSQPQMGSSGCAVLQSHPRAGASLSPHPKEHHKCIQKCFTISGGFWSSQLCSSTSISASPLLTTVLGHIWSLGPNCEIRSQPSSSHCPPWLQDLPGKYI